jgi:hypothetical protein
MRGAVSWQRESTSSHILACAGFRIFPVALHRFWKRRQKVQERQELLDYNGRHGFAVCACINFLSDNIIITQ